MRNLVAAVIATLTLVLALSFGTTGAAARDGKRVLDRRHVQQTAHRSSARRHRHERHRGETAPTTAPSPSPEEPAKAPGPAPGPSPEAVESTPAPAPTQTSTPTSGGRVLFNGSFDSGFGGWYVQSLSSRATLLSSGAFQGSQAARFEVRQGDVEPDTGSQRSEVSGPTFDEGEDLYIRDAIRVPSTNTFSAPWQIIQQLHEEDWGGSPGVALFLDNSHALKLGAGALRQVHTVDQVIPAVALQCRALPEGR